MRSWLVCLLLLVACDHSTPFAGVRGGAEGPLTDTAPFFLTIDTVQAVAWSSDERGILIRLGRRPPLSPPDPPGWVRVPPGLEVGNCLALLPAEGGSALWRHCDVGPEPSGRVALLGEADVSPEGRVVFVRVDKPRGFTFPIGARIDLWVVDTANGNIPARLQSLYRDSLGRSPTPLDQVNWYTALTFLDSRRILALGQHLRPDGNAFDRGWFLGDLDGSAVTWRTLPRPPSGGTPIPADNARSLLWWRADGTVTLTGVDGTVQEHGTIPRGEQSVVTSVRCRGMQCLALIRTPDGPQYDRYVVRRLQLAGLTSDSVGAFLHASMAVTAVGTARGTVLVTTDRRLALLPGVVPILP